MSLFSSFAGVLVVTVSLSGSSDSHEIVVLQETLNGVSVAPVVMQVADCEQSRKKVGTGTIVIPRLELHVKPIEKELIPEDEEPTGFCAGTFGSPGRSPQCHFQLLA